MKKFILATVVAAATLGTVANAAADKAAFGFNAGIQTGSKTGLVFGATYKMANSDGNFFADFGANRVSTGSNSSNVDGHSITLGYQFVQGYTIGYRMEKTDVDGNAGHEKHNSIMIGMNDSLTGGNTFGCATNLYTTQKTAAGVETTHDSFDMGLCTLSHSFM
jgi:opacity protein-like surface antigen